MGLDTESYPLPVTPPQGPANNRITSVRCCALKLVFPSFYICLTPQLSSY